MTYCMYANLIRWIAGYEHLAAGREIELTGTGLEPRWKDSEVALKEILGNYIRRYSQSFRALPWKRKGSSVGTCC